jgi:hypothetical protein
VVFVVIAHAFFIRTQRLYNGVRGLFKKAMSSAIVGNIVHLKAPPAMVKYDGASLCVPNHVKDDWRLSSNEQGATNSVGVNVSFIDAW